jgi:glycosyltransferase involved in cell wall biosynthesis
MDQISPYLGFDLAEIILLGCFIVFFVIEIIFYVVFFRAPLRFAKKQADNNTNNADRKLPAVSVIVVSSNEAEHIEKTLPAILEQDYPDFEVIVVNNGSTDETDMVIKSLQIKYDRLYGTYLPLSRDHIFGRKKLAMTIGIKAAKNEVVLFTEACCMPLTNKWIYSMMSQMKQDKDIVAGHSFFYEKPHSTASRLIAFDNLMYCLQYMSMIIRKKPFSATYRNFALRKKLFFEHKGFASVLNYEYGEELFLNEIMTGENTSLCLSPDSFVEGILEERENYIWKGYKIAYQKMKKHFVGHAQHVFALETFCRYATPSIWIALLLKSIISMQFTMLAIATLIYVIKDVFQMMTINKCGKLLKSGKFYFSWPFLNLLQPFRDFYYQTHKDKTKNTIGNY